MQIVADEAEALARGPLCLGGLRARASIGHRRLWWCFAQRRPSASSTRRGRASSTYAAREQVTFWSGFVLPRAAACVPLDVYFLTQTLVSGLVTQTAPSEFQESGSPCVSPHPHKAPPGTRVASCSQPCWWRS